MIQLKYITQVMRVANINNNSHFAAIYFLKQFCMQMNRKENEF